MRMKTTEIKRWEKNGKTEKFKEDKSIHLLLSHPLKSKRLGIGVRDEEKKLHYQVKHY